MFGLVMLVCVWLGYVSLYLVTLLARNSERSLVTSDPGATGKFSGIPLEIQ